MSRLRARLSPNRLSGVLVAAIAALSACSKTGSPPNEFGVNVTVATNMLSSSQRAKISLGSLTVVSDKTGAMPKKTVDGLPAAIAKGDLHFHYSPAATVKPRDKLSFGLDVFANTQLIASGSGGPVTLETGAVAVTITLVPVGGDDGGTTDASNTDVNAGEVINPSGKANGVACVTNDECGTGLCTDGVCCNEKCNDVCVSCNQTGSKGTCTAYAVDTDPEMECAAKIPTTPMDTDAGATTTDASSAEGGAADGGDAAASDAASPVAPEAGAMDAGDSDALVINTPDGGVMSMPTACGGTCGGARACKYPDKTKSCGTPFCNTHKEIAGFTCDGNGGCAIGVSECTAFGCNDATGACRTTCSDHADCQTGFYCDGATHKCVDKKGPALTCVTDDECKSTHCSSGVCCNTACNTAPLSCNSSGKVGMCVCPECTTGACQIYYPDTDGDTFGDRTATYGAGAKAACAGAPPVGFVADNTDCDDKDPMAHPGQTSFFGFASKGGRFDYDCDDKNTKETPEYPGGSCKFCGAVGSCETTSTACTSTSQTGSFQCPQEYSGGIIRAASETVSELAPLERAGLAASPSDAFVSYASVAPGGGTAIPIQPPICRVCVLQCCGCAAADKAGFRQVVACGDTSVSEYTCGSCTAVGGAPAMTASFKQQRCR